MDLRLRHIIAARARLAGLAALSLAAAAAPGAEPALLFSEQGAAASKGYDVWLRRTDGSAPIRLGQGRALHLAPDGRWALTRPLDSARLELLPTGVGEPTAVSFEGLERYTFVVVGMTVPRRRPQGRLGPGRGRRGGRSRPVEGSHFEPL